ncbi:MAG: hypothetical protein A3H98_05145 [Bacteroidetes bacterium RIFCSPLOWO2_02_FULL_36_8]|nr:MAG: hypothetical protein A3H98_05145 [Bacteroidetes bacterium RIFCSPLOWO2_02_FULL_36_8]
MIGINGKIFAQQAKEKEEVEGGDCSTSIPVSCETNTTNLPALIDGGGIENDNLTSTSCFRDEELRSIWYSFTFSTAGTFTFTIHPSGYYDWYNFALYDITNGCANKGNAIRCVFREYYSGGNGITGLNFTATETSEYWGDGFVKYLDAEIGHTYALCLDTDLYGSGIYSITFGGTARLSGNLPTAQFSSSPNTVCPNSPINFTNQSTYAHSYLWDFGDGTATSTELNPTHTYTTGATSYTVTLTAFNNCSSDVFTQVISANNTAPVINPISSQSICAQSEVCFPIIVNDANYDNLTVEFSGITGAVFENIYTEPGYYEADLCWTPTNSDVGVYTVTISVKDEHCPPPYPQSITTYAFQITVLLPSVITVYPTSSTICRGQSVTLTASGASSYLWSTGATTDSINVSPTINTTYFVRDINECGGVATATINVNFVTISPPSPTVETCGGQPGSVTLTATGTPPFIWNTGSSNAFITVSPITNTTYAVTDANNCQELITVNVTASNIPPDLWMKDYYGDNGQEPHNFVPGLAFDIWNRVYQDGGLIHQDPDYSANNNPNYLYIKVRNRGCQASLGTEQLKVYWTKMTTASSWPFYWVNYMNYGKIWGNIIPATPVTIPVIPAGDFTIIEIPWFPFNPADFGLPKVYICLLARIETSTPNPSNPNNPFGMAFDEESDVLHNVKRNNNIIMKNIHVVNENPDNIVVQTGNVYCEVATSYNFLFNIAEEEINQPFTADGMVRIDLGKEIYEKWVKGGRKGRGFEVGKFSHMSRNGILHHHSLQHFPNAPSPYTISITGTAEATIENIQFEPCERLPILVGFNYNAQPEGVNKKEFNYDVIQTVTENNSEMGRVRFNIHRPDCVTPNAGADQTIGRGCKTILTASPIENGNTYTWYDNATGSFIAQGSSIEVSPANTTTYELQMVSVNGCVEYDLVTINMDSDDNAIACIPDPNAYGCFREVEVIPNPAGGNELRVKFIAEEKNNINVSLINSMGKVYSSDNLKVEPGPIEHKLPLDKVPVGVYRVIIKCKEKMKEVMVERL